MIKSLFVFPSRIFELIKLSVETFKPLIVIYIMVIFVYYHWGISIYRPLSYPFRSLTKLMIYLFRRQKRKAMRVLMMILTLTLMKELRYPRSRYVFRRKTWQILGVTHHRALSSTEKNLILEIIWLKVYSQMAKITMLSSYPCYPIPSPPTGWTNWPINEVHICKLNWRHIFPVNFVNTFYFTGDERRAREGYHQR